VRNLIAELRSAGTKTFPLGRAKRKGVGGKESFGFAQDKLLPALAFVASFSAAAEFRASKTGAPPLLNSI